MDRLIRILMLGGIVEGGILFSWWMGWGFWFGVLMMLPVKIGFVWFFWDKYRKDFAMLRASFAVYRFTDELAEEMRDLPIRQAFVLNYTAQKTIADMMVKKVWTKDTNFDDLTKHRVEMNREMENE